MDNPKGLTPTRFVRGGQSTQHWFRMAGQVFTTFVAVSFGTFGIVLALLLMMSFEVSDMYLLTQDAAARYFHGPLNHEDYVFQLKNIPDVPKSLSVAEFLSNPIIQERISGMKSTALRMMLLAGIPSLLAGIAIILVYARTGRGLGQTKHERGTRLVSHAELKRWVKAKWKEFETVNDENVGGPRYTIAGIEFPPNAVQAQTSLTGTVGTGKTTAMTELLNVIREEHGRCIIYDRTGSLVEKFYDPMRGDKIVNPFDARSVAWSPFYEASDIASFAQMAEVLIPQKADAPDPFWQTTARLVFEAAARKLMERGDDNNRSLREAISLMPDEELMDLVAKTPAAQLLNEKNPKTASSIRANMISELRFFEYLRDDGERFSIRDWVKEPEQAEGFIFLTGDAEHAAATRNIISACLEIASNALMTCGQSRHPKIWFLVDELPSLNRLPFIEKSLAEIRQFGGAYVIGYQVYAQLEQVYGENGAKTITGVCNNRIVFNNPHYETAENSAESLGKEDVIDQRHNITMGAHSTRDGVGFSEQRVERFIVTGSEIQSLPQLDAYLRFAYDAPTAKVKFKPISLKKLAAGYIPYHGDGFAEGSLEIRKPEGAASNPVPSVVKRIPNQELTVEEQWGLFREWQSHWRDDYGLEHAHVARFDPKQFDVESDEYENAYWDQNWGWQQFFTEHAYGLEAKQIDPRNGSSEIGKDMRVALLKVVPPYPILWRTEAVEETKSEAIVAAPAPERALACAEVPEIAPKAVVESAKQPTRPPVLAPRSLLEAAKPETLPSTVAPPAPDLFADAALETLDPEDADALALGTDDLSDLLRGL